MTFKSDFNVGRFFDLNNCRTAALELHFNLCFIPELKAIIFPVIAMQSNQLDNLLDNQLLIGRKD